VEITIHTQRSKGSNEKECPYVILVLGW